MFKVKQKSHKPTKMCININDYTNKRMRWQSRHTRMAHTSMHQEHSLSWHNNWTLMTMNILRISMRPS